MSTIAKFVEVKKVEKVFRPSVKVHVFWEGKTQKGKAVILCGFSEAKTPEEAVYVYRQS